MTRTTPITGALRDLQRRPFWLDRPERPQAHPHLEGDHDADLLVVGGGFSGLWTAILAKQRNPGRDVLLVDGDRVAGAASGRNGGFLHASLTHGLANGLARFPDEVDVLVRLGHANLDAIRRFVREHAIDCDWRDSGELEVATADHHVAELRQRPEQAAAVGEHLRWLEADELATRLRMAGARGAVLEAHGVAMVDPARLAWGLARVAEELGVRLHEGSLVTGLERGGDGIVARVEGAQVRARRVALATNAARSPLPAVRRRIVPVYDYALVTEPLSADQWAAIGWDGFEGLKGAGNRFHYARRTEDGRILWGGFDAVYHRGGRVDPRYDHDDAVYERLASQFLDAFPALQGLRFTHGWGGAIDTCSRFVPFWQPAFDGRVVATAGFTGLGVGSSRFAAGIALDLLDDRSTPERSLAMVRSRPVPFPPEPLRTFVIGATQWSLARADERGGRRNAWLRLLDAIGVGFDS